MKRIIIFLIAAFPLAANSEEFTCTYNTSTSSEPVIIKLNISGKKASGSMMHLEVLENTNIGVVLVNSFAYKNSRTKENEIGAYVITIDKTTMKMTRGNVFNDYPDGNIIHGKCIQ